jgi:hypothetical protein
MEEDELLAPSTLILVNSEKARGSKQPERPNPGKEGIASAIPGGEMPGAGGLRRAGTRVQRTASASSLSARLIEVQLSYRGPRGKFSTR